MKNKIKEKIVLFAVLVDEKVKSIKPLIVKYKLLIGISIVALIGLCMNTPSETKSDEIKYSDTKPNTKTEEKIKEKDSHEGYKVLNNELYQRGIDYYYNSSSKADDLWKAQASIPFISGEKIEGHAIEQNISESDMTDYFYGTVTSILKDTRDNLHKLENEGANAELIDYEKKILGFIEKVHKNYSMDLIIPKDEEDQYFNWIDSKKALLDKLNNEEDSKYEDTQTDTDEEEKEDASLDIGDQVETPLGMATIKPVYNGFKTKVIGKYMSISSSKDINKDDLIEFKNDKRLNLEEFNWVVAEFGDGTALDLSYPLSTFNYCNFSEEDGFTNIMGVGSIVDNKVEYSTDLQN